MGKLNSDVKNNSGQKSWDALGFLILHETFVSLLPLDNVASLEKYIR